MKRRRWLIVLAVVVLVVGGGGFAAIKKLRGKPDLVRTVKVRSGRLVAKVSETGTVEPFKKVEVKSKVGGRIKVLNVDEGDWVVEGQVIAELDVPEIERQAEQAGAQVDAAQATVVEQEAAYAVSRKQVAAELAEARAGYAEAQARLEQVRKGPRQQEIARARAAVEEAKARLNDARRTLERQRGLLEKGFVSQQEVDAAQTQHEVATQALEQAQEQLDMLLAGSRPEEIRAAEQAAARAKAAVEVAVARQGELAVRRAGIARAKAQEKQIRKSLEEIETKLRDAIVVAPCSGRVIKRHIRAGELITSGVTTFTSGMAIVTLGDMSKMLATVDLNEVDIARVRLGMPAEITLDAIAGKRFDGKVTRIAPAASGEGGGQPVGRGGIVRFAVEVELSDATPQVRPGMTANVDLIVARRKHAVYVPKEAVYGDSGSWVWVKNGEGREKRTVKTGISNETYTEILSGLEPGEELTLVDERDVHRRVMDVGRSSAGEHMRGSARRR